MRIAVCGDIHGHWRDLKASVLALHQHSHLDLVLQCGDAQPFRDESDLAYMHCPEKYLGLGDFHVFHQGMEEFPVPMLFVGGNHEPWGYLDEHRDGGVLAENITFLGRSGLTTVNGLRIGGISGIFSPKQFGRPHPTVPYPTSRRKQATYYNQDDIERAMGFGQVDILLLHDWPDLMNAARDEDWPSRWSHVGCEHLSRVVETLHPKWVFCGHMHRRAILKVGTTEIICLSDFHRDPANAAEVINPD